MSEPRLSGLMVVHNEAARLEDALRSLAFCDEIVVVCDRCTDDTADIARRFTPHVIEGAWELEGPRRMTGIDACTGDWILELDGDERVTPDMQAEMKHRLPTAPHGYFLVPIYNYVGRRHVKYGWAGSFGTTAAKKLFYKGCKVWGPQRVHPQVTLKGTESRLEHGLLHFVDDDINDMIDRLKRYTDAAAADLRGTSLPPFRTTVRKSLTRFYKSYVARQGWREGRMGVLLAVMAALFPLLAHIKAEVEPK